MKLILPLPADTPFGNLLLKHTQIIMRLDRVNAMVQTIYRSFEKIHTQNISDDLFEHTFLSEQVIYWLRKTADELIGLHYVLTEREESGSYPNRVAPDSIGNLLSHKDISLPFVEHMNFLTTLNEISNAYKHSFVNSDLSLIGRDEPVVFALGLKRNALNNSPKFYAVPLQEVISRFDAFFVSMTEELRKCKIPHLAPQQSKH